MTLPTRDEAAGWIGHRVIDTNGVDIGTCIKIYADDDTEALEWIGVALHGGANAVVPIGGSKESGGTVTVVFSREAVVAAPVAASLDFLSREDEVNLYEHYGVPYTSAASTTTLPLGEDPEADLQAAASTPEGAEVPADEAAPVTEVPASEPVAAAAGDTPGQDTPAAATTGQDTPVQDTPVPSTRGPWPTPEPLPTSRVLPALVAGGVVVAGAAAVRYLPIRQLPIRRRPTRSAPTRTLSRAWDRVPPVKVPLDRLTGVDYAGLARRTGWGAVHAAMVPSAYGALAAQRTAGAVRSSAPRAGKAVQNAGHGALSGANRVVATTAETASATVAGITGTAESIYDTWRNTMGLLKNSLIFGGGYVLGTRAGREQYEVIKAKAAELAQSPTVQQATGKVKGTVGQKLPGARRRQGFDATAYPTPTPVPPSPVAPATVSGLEDPVTAPRDLTIDLTDDVPSSTQRLP